MNVAILGHGVVGSGVAEVIQKNSNSINMRAGESIRLAKILDIRDFPDCPYGELFTKNPDDIFNDPSIDIVVETIGGEGIAFEYTKRAFEAKKHVVTSNKEVIASKGPELLKMAADNNVKYLFEASVGGGIPIIHPLSQDLAANEINGITGILNGTTNYILTKMRTEGMEFEEALKGAQEKGYAEANPKSDVEGLDSCRKLAILSSIAYNEFVDYRDIYTEGITNISSADFKYAALMNSAIKLIAVSRRMPDGKISARVCPALISRKHPLAGVEDVFNAIVVSGDAIGDAMFYGRGAGKLPTASAVVADIIYIAKHKGEAGKMLWEKSPDKNVIDFSETESQYFVRLETTDAENARAGVARIFGDVEFFRPVALDPQIEVAFKTGTDKEGKLKNAIDKLLKAPSITKVNNIIRVLG